MNPILSIDKSLSNRLAGFRPRPEDQGLPLAGARSLLSLVRMWREDLVSIIGFIPNGGFILAW